MNKDYGEMTGCNNFCSFTNQGVVAARVIRGYEQPHIDVPPIYSLNTWEAGVEASFGGQE
jgi:hypothetical protein